MRRALFAAIVLTATLALVGCQKPSIPALGRQEACAPGDSPEGCKGFQECCNSGTVTIEACREAEKIAADYSHNYDTNIAPAYKGGAEALLADPSKAAQKPATKHQQQQQPKKP